MDDLPRTVLADVIAAVHDGGRLLAAEFSSSDGPRGGEHKAPIDLEIELMLRPRLLALIPGRFIGEEAGTIEAPSGSRHADYAWAVDPQDGTKAFGEGRRGSAVSVGLLHRGVPVLGVVFAPTSPDRGPDMIAWADGCPAILRNGAPVTHDLAAADLVPGAIVLLNHTSGLRPLTASGRVAPAGFVPMPSIAYRLARIAVGDAVGTMSLNTISALDYAAGHALLRGAGGVLTDGAGQAVTYTDLGDSEAVGCFGGAPKAVATMLDRTWRGSTEPRREWRVKLGWPRAVENAALDRAVGAMLGMLIGDSGRAAGGLPGQPGPGGEAALAYARGLLAGAMGADGGELGGVPRGIALGTIGGTIGGTAGGTIGPSISGTAGEAIAAAISAGIAGADHATVRRLAGDQRDPALTGALLGATSGRQAFAAREGLALMACRPDTALGVTRPRPDALWPDDVVDLAEALLLRRAL
jgi:fructose-1,6-bisphosphatase/inositol monophosphatase family enzyme